MSSIRGPASLGLRGRVLVALFALLGGLMAATAALVLRRSEAALREADETRATALARQLAESSRYAVLAKSEALLEGPLEELARGPDLVEVEVLDDGGQRIAVRRGAAQGPAALEVSVSVRTATIAPGDEARELDAFGIAAGQAPRDIGRVVVRLSREATAKIRAELRRDLIFAFFVAGIAGAVVALMLASSLVRRIRELAAAAAAVAGGSFSVRVPEDGGDELAALAHDFNGMTASLEAQRGELDRAAEALAEREALAAIGRATAVIAHELRNPLGILLGAAQVASSPTRPEAARQQAAKMLEGEVRRLEATLSGLLTYAKPRAPARTAIVAMDAVRRAIERATSPGGPAVGLDVRAEGDGVARVLVDEQQLAQILLNLLQNAAQAGAKGVTITVEAAREAGTRVHLVVRDDGPGIDAKVRDQLFLPFVTTKSRGAGLGLAGSRRMARDNGGDLTLLASERGAAFVVELAASP